MGVLLACLPADATAQSNRASSNAHHAKRNAVPPRTSSLTSHLSTAVAQRLLRSPNEQDRLRAVRRLGSQGTYASVQVLLQAIIDNDRGRTLDPKLRLEAIRALAPFASREPVQRVLISWATNVPTRGKNSGPLMNLAGDQAAMALAASANVRAIEQLVIGISEGGRASQRMAMALEAHPPRNIEPLLRNTALKSPDVVKVLGKLGDLRAIPKLRRILFTGDIDVKVVAAVALARLGDAAGVKASRGWINQEGSTHSLRIGAAQTLTLCRDSFAPKAIAILLADPQTREQGLSLAEQAPTPQLSPTLAGLLTIAKGAERVRVLASLARCGGPLAVQTLDALVRKSPVDVDAAYALAHSRDPGASTLIAQLIERQSTRRMGVRAALVRLLELGQQVEGLDDVLETLTTSQDPADRSVGVFGAVITGEASVEDYTSSSDSVMLLAACRATLGTQGDNAQQCISQLSSKTRPVLRDGLAGTLIQAESISEISTNTLMRWAESSQVSSPIFGRAVGSRDDDAFRARIARLLWSGDPAMRSQVALGLGHSPKASATTLLTKAYLFEANALVRRAAILGLATRQSKVGRKWLEIAARLDPDEQTRSLARHAISGRRLSEPTQGNQVLWLRLVGSGPSEWVGNRPIQILMSNGYATLAVTAPDGQVLVPGMTPGSVKLRVAQSPSPQQEPKKK
ncbi:MAG: hypothetical protein CSA75_02610 [Sorangium cellulosum]|nr:MAG: hypothetical protein CSA75_02610 [Sorangium cellulosum]